MATRELEVDLREEVQVVGLMHRVEAARAISIQL